MSHSGKGYDAMQKLQDLEDKERASDEAFATNRKDPAVWLIKQVSA